MTNCWLNGKNCLEQRLKRYEPWDVEGKWKGKRIFHFIVNC